MEDEPGVPFNPRDYLKWGAILGGGTIAGMALVASMANTLTSSHEVGNQAAPTHSESYGMGISSTPAEDGNGPQNVSSDPNHDPTPNYHVAALLELSALAGTSNILAKGIVRYRALPRYPVYMQPEREATGLSDGDKQAFENLYRNLYED